MTKNRSDRGFDLSHVRACRRFEGSLRTAYLSKIIADSNAPDRELSFDPLFIFPQYK